MRWVEQHLAVRLLARGSEVHVQGHPDNVAFAAEVLSSAYSQALVGTSVTPALLQHLAQVQRQAGASKPPAESSIYQEDLSPALRSVSASRGQTFARTHAIGRLVSEPDAAQPPVALAKTPGQTRYLQALEQHDLVFAVGPAGTGKTYLAVAAALGALQRHECKRIILTRPAVEAGERLGFLPGDLAEKVSPYVRPLYDALRDLAPSEKVDRWMERGQIEVAPLAFMRGRTLSNAFVIVDEAQNCTVEQMLMLLTRMGEHTRMVVTGDPSQVDLPRGQRSGLAHAAHLLESIQEIGMVTLHLQDVVRHPLVARIAAAYEADRQRGGEP